jgi:dipeptidyl aminopeptidase/acylaminoacyl peptidase
MRKLIVILGGAILLSLAALGLAWQYFAREEGGFLSPVGSLLTEKPKEKPLEKFNFEALSQRQFPGSEITLERELNESDTFTAYLFTYFSDGKKVSGLAHIPKGLTGQRAPVIVMLRGWVDQKEYQTGVGTQRAGEVLAQNGYITLAPDFLGYGESDMPENDIWWERLNNPIVVLNLLSSIKSLPQADSERIGIWAHSNGGQIALSVLEITQKTFPTTLWAPVSKPFPYSILYYTDEFEDEGKALRAELAQFEQDYDVRRYSITDYLGQIKAPLQVHQGTVDDAVPKEWSDELVEKLEELAIDVDYFVYPGADHNMVGSWDTVVARDVAFLDKYL